MDLSRLTLPQRISGVAMLVVIIGAFLPWVSVLGISVNGLNGDGVLTLFAAVAGLVILALTTGLIGGEPKSHVVLDYAPIVLAVLVTFIALVDMNSYAAIGLYLTLFGGIGWVVGAAMPYASKISR